MKPLDVPKLREEADQICELFVTTCSIFQNEPDSLPNRLRAVEALRELQKRARAMELAVAEASRP